MTQEVHPQALAPVAVEVWRLGRRLSHDPAANPRLMDSFNRLVRALEDANIRIDDPIGQPFLEGMNAEIIDVPLGLDLATEQLHITDVLRPAVYVHKRCVLPPQILLDKVREEVSE